MRDGTNNSTNLYVYFLNPKYHYTKDFSIDGNVEDGLYDYIEHMVPNKKKQHVIHNTLLDYNESINTFDK
jgi:hypothetical protein